MKILSAALVLVMSLVLLGCANKTARDAVRLMNSDAEKSGSPFRWKSDTIQGQTILQLTLLELPAGPTKAEGGLREAILAEVTRRELAQGRPPAEVAEVKLMTDGREVWVLKSVKYGVAYVLRMGRGADGRVGFVLEGPIAFQRKGDIPRELDLVLLESYLRCV